MGPRIEEIEEDDEDADEWAGFSDEDADEWNGFSDEDKEEEKEVCLYDNKNRK
jgi:hypothetical protein